MAETIQMNVIVLPVTKERVERMARDTFRGKGDLIDFLVDQAYRQMYSLSSNPVDVFPTEKVEGA
jgi:hypothetical protein